MAISGNGTNAYIRTTNAYAHPTSGYTYSFLIYSDSAVGAAIKQPFTHCNNQGYGFSWGHSNANFQKAAFQEDNGGWHAAKIATGIVANTWYVITVTWDGSNNLKIYLDGSIEDTEAGVAQIKAENNEKITLLSGVTWGDPDSFFDGDIAEFAYWKDKVLSTGQIASLGKKISPLLVDPGFDLYIPCIRTIYDYGGTALSSANTGIAAHPNVIYPAAPLIITGTAAVGAEFELLVGAGGMDGDFLGGSLNPMTG